MFEVTALPEGRAAAKFQYVRNGEVEALGELRYEALKSVVCYFLGLSQHYTSVVFSSYVLGDVVLVGAVASSEEFLPHSR